MRLLFLTDTHYRNDTPKSRIDDILKAQLQELGEIAELVHEHDVDAIIHGGDFFDTKNPPHKLVVDLIAWCKHIEVPIYVCIGNHDVTGYNLDSVKNSGLGVLFESYAAEPLNEKVFEKEKIVLRGVHSTKDFKFLYEFDKKYDGWTKIALSHNYIIPSDTMPFDFIHPKDIPSNADFVLCGHYHVPFDYSTSTTRWINPGALSRWTISERDRKPTVLLLNIVDGKTTVEYIELKSSRPGCELFDVEELALEKARDADISSFVKSLEQTDFKNVDVEQVVLKIGREQAIPEAVLNLALKKIREAKEVLR